MKITEGSNAGVMNKLKINDQKKLLEGTNGKNWLEIAGAKPFFRGIKVMSVLSITIVPANDEKTLNQSQIWSADRMGTTNLKIRYLHHDAIKHCFH